MQCRRFLTGQFSKSEVCSQSVDAFAPIAQVGSAGAGDHSNSKCCIQVQFVAQKSAITSNNDEEFVSKLVASRLEAATATANPSKQL
jgi:hypothetical protein